MFTDEKLRQLHLDAEYQRNNCLLKNLKYSVYIVKNGNGYFSLSMNTSLNVSLSINLIKIFWFILRYLFITKELVDFRKKVIEYVLHDYYDEKFDIIKNSLSSTNKWLEFTDEKLLVTKDLCIEYLSDVDNRLVFIKYSTQSKEVTEKTLIKTISLLDRIFEDAIEKSKFQRLSRLSYEYILTQNNSGELQHIIGRAMKSGNLTSKGRES